MGKIFLRKFFTGDHLGYLNAIPDFNPSLPDDAQQHVVEVCMLYTGDSWLESGLQGHDNRYLRASRGNRHLSRQ